MTDKRTRRVTAKSERARRMRTKEMRDFLTMHRCRCLICKHPDLKEIEKAYIAGTPVADICEAYQIRLRDSLDTHIRALQLRTLAEAKAAKSTRLRCRNILHHYRVTADEPPPKEMAMLAMKLEHEAEMIDKPRHLHLSGSVELKTTLVPAAEEMARNILLRGGMPPEQVEKYLPSASFETLVKLGLGKAEEPAEEEEG